MILLLLLIICLAIESTADSNCTSLEHSNIPEYLFKKWENSQVFIYVKAPCGTQGKIGKIFEKTKLNKLRCFDFPQPDCFGTLLTSQYVLTASSCFMDVERLVYLFQDPGGVYPQFMGGTLYF